MKLSGISSSNQWLGMQNSEAKAFFSYIWPAAVPVLSITGAGGTKWKRNMADPADPRVGPWLQATFEVLDHAMWRRKSDCLYFVVSRADEKLRYVGKSKKQVSERWRMSPALCATTGVELPDKQLFHSQCMKPMQSEFGLRPTATFEVRTLGAGELRPMVTAAGMLAFDDHASDSDFIEALEKWFCRSGSPDFATWNKAGTGPGSRS